MIIVAAIASPFVLVLALLLLRHELRVWRQLNEARIPR